MGKTKISFTILQKDSSILRLKMLTPFPPNTMFHFLSIFMPQPVYKHWEQAAHFLTNNIYFLLETFRLGESTEFSLADDIFFFRGSIEGLYFKLVEINGEKKRAIYKHATCIPRWNDVETASMWNTRVVFVSILL